MIYLRANKEYKVDVLNQNERYISKKKLHYSVLFILDLYLLLTSCISIFATQIKYKEDLQILKGMGCFLMDTPDMVRSRHLRKLWVSTRPSSQHVAAPTQLHELGRTSACSHF